MRVLSKYNLLEAERAKQALIEEIGNIRYVKQWAVEVGFSVSKLQRIILHCYGMSAKEVLKLIRYKRIIEIIKEDPLATSYNVAFNTGLKNDWEWYEKWIPNTKN